MLSKGSCNSNVAGMNGGCKYLPHTAVNTRHVAIVVEVICGLPSWQDCIHLLVFLDCNI